MKTVKVGLIGTETLERTAEVVLSIPDEFGKDDLLKVADRLDTLVSELNLPWETEDANGPNVENLAIEPTNKAPDATLVRDQSTGEITIVTNGGTVI